VTTKIFSLILATCGRVQEVDRFLHSIGTQDFNLSKIEVIIVDQNGNNGIDIVPIIRKHQDKVDIRHIKSDRRGLSLSRNIGLRLAKGEFVAFPDDDCLYYPDTLFEAQSAFNLNPDMEVFLGRIVDRATRKNIIRDWKNSSLAITRQNFYLNFSSITLFSRKNSIRFEETLGLGTYYGSNEDADYILQVLEKGEKIQYTPAIEVWHPANPPIVDFQKVYSYGLGFGALCRKHQGLVIGLLFVKVIGYHSLLMLLSAVTLDMQQAKRRFMFVASRLHGLVSYKNG